MLPPVLAALFLIPLALFVWGGDNLRGTGLFRTAVQPQIRSLAVLPFRTYLAIRSTKFCRWHDQGVDHRTLRIGPLRVISQTSMMQYKGEKKSPAADWPRA